MTTARTPEAIAWALPDHGNRLLAVPLDVTDEERARTAETAAVARFGSIDVLVNIAGRGLLAAVEEASDAEVPSIYGAKVFGLLHGTRAVLPIMRAAGTGTLVHIDSRSGFEGEPGVSMYSASKFAVAGISEALAAELAPFGTRSVVVEPGELRTDILDASSVQRPAHLLPAYDGTPAHVTL